MSRTSKCFVILTIILISATLFWIFIYENQYEKMINEYVEYCSDLYEQTGTTLYVLDAALYDADYSDIENLERTVGWHDCLLTVKHDARTEIFYIHMSHLEDSGLAVMGMSTESYNVDKIAEHRIHMFKIHGYSLSEKFKLVS